MSLLVMFAFSGALHLDFWKAEYDISLSNLLSIFLLKKKREVERKGTRKRITEGKWGERK